MKQKTGIAIFLTLFATVSGSMDVNLMEKSRFVDSTCNFTGNLVLSHPMSIDITDRYYATSSLMQSAYELTVLNINTKRCGVKIGKDSFSLALRTFGDRSSENTIGTIATNIVNDPTSDFFLGGYKSSLTRIITPIAQNASKLIISGGAAAVDAFANKSLAFGVLDTVSKRHIYEFKYLVKKKGANSLAVILENGITASGNIEKARTAGFTTIHDCELPATPNATIIESVINDIKSQNPEVVFISVAASTNIAILKALYDAKFSPKAIYIDRVDDSVDVFYKSYAITRTSWLRTMPMLDPVTGWTSDVFAESFMKYCFRNATYQAASASAVISILVQAIEAAQSIKQSKVVNQLNTRSFLTVYSNVTFDSNGQSLSSGLMLQFDKDGYPLIVGPPPDNTTDDLIYPIPTWEQRDCFRNGLCIMTNGACLRSGVCECKNLKQRSEGVGLNATCGNYLIEDYNYISEQTKLVGLVLVSIQSSLSVAAIIWTYFYRKDIVIRKSQPIFLNLSAVGCLVMVLSIIPMGIQEGYRHIYDEIRGLETSEVNTQVYAVDIGCMATPWLWNIGFSLAFSALFAKIVRIKKVFENAQNFRRVKILPKDVAFIVVIIVGLQLVLLTTWQLVSPWKWERKIRFINTNESTKESQGRCDSEHGQTFFITMIISHVLFLLYALYLCWISKNVPSDLSEAKFIAISVFSMFEILLVGLLVLFFAEYNPRTNYLIQVMLVFSQTFLLTAFLYVPKILKRKENTGYPTANATQSRLTNNTRSNQSTNVTTNVTQSRLPAISRPIST